MKIYTTTSNVTGKPIEVFTNKRIYLQGSLIPFPALGVFEYVHLNMKRKSVFWQELRKAARQLRNGEYLNAFVFEFEMEVGYPKLEREKKPFHVKLISNKEISLEELKRNFL